MKVVQCHVQHETKSMFQIGSISDGTSLRIYWEEDYITVNENFSIPDLACFHGLVPPHKTHISFDFISFIHGMVFENDCDCQDFMY